MESSEIDPKESEQPAVTEVLANLQQQIADLDAVRELCTVLCTLSDAEGCIIADFVL